MDELIFAKLMARRAGVLMRESFMKINVLSKTDGSAVTTTDRDINRMVIEAVKKDFPHYAIIGEEESHVPKQSLGTWVCDPIDGTLPYILGIPTCVFSLALLSKKGEPETAVVYDPFLERTYWASKGKGAFGDGNVPLKVNFTSRLDEAFIGNSGRSSEVIDGPKFKKYLYSHCYRPVVLHSVIYEAMLVASGKIAATILTGSAAHDAASAKLIVEEAGGKVTDLFGEEQRYDRPIRGAIISNGQIHDSIVELAKSYRL